MFRAILPILLLSLVACEKASHAPFEDPLHGNAVRLPPPNAGLPPPDPEPAAQVFPVPPPPFSPGIFPCSRCHVGGTPAPDTKPAIPHKKHLDRDLTCEDCHGKETKVPTAETCFECHEDLGKEPAAVQAYFAAVRTPDGKYEMPRRVKTHDVLPNHAGHAKAGVTCAECHGEPANTPFAKERSVAWMARCVACHTERKASTKCETCHKEIREPQHKNIVLHHAEGHHCLDCHDREDRDFLRLAGGEKVPFDKSYRVCGQCHGPNLRDWKQGLHGKRTGMWDGEKTYLLCVHCHKNPHAPQFPHMAPEPPPARPEDIK